MGTRGNCHVEDAAILGVLFQILLIFAHLVGDRLGS